MYVNSGLIRRAKKSTRNPSAPLQDTQDCDEKELATRPVSWRAHVRGYKLVELTEQRRWEGGSNLTPLDVTVTHFGERGQICPGAKK